MGISVQYIANAGAAVMYKGKGIMIDGLHKVKVAPYETVDDITLNKLMNIKEPFGFIDIILVTHNHKDHFDARTTIRFMEVNKEVSLYGPEAVCIELLKRTNVPQIIHRIHCIGSESVTVEEGIVITGVVIAHEGRQYSGVQNLGYIVDFYDKRLVHLGDSKVNRHEYVEIKEMFSEIDIAMLNFPFVTLDQGRRIVCDCIRPSKLYIFHLPTIKEDSFGWIGTTVDNMKKYSSVLPDAEIFV